MNQANLERASGPIQARCEDSAETRSCDLASSDFGTTSVCSAINLVLDRDPDADDGLPYYDNELYRRDVTVAKEVLLKNTRFGTLAPQVQEIFLSIFTVRWERINQAFTEDGFEFKCPEEERPNLRANIMVAAVTMIEKMVALNDAQPHEDIMTKFEKQKKIVDLLEQFDLSTFHLVEANLAVIEGKITKTQAAKLQKADSRRVAASTDKMSLGSEHKEFQKLLNANIELNVEVRRLENEQAIAPETVKLLLQLDFELLKFLITGLISRLKETDTQAFVIEEFAEKVKILTELEKFCEAGLLSIDRLHRPDLIMALLSVGKVYVEKMPSFLVRIDALVKEKQMTLIVAKDLKKQLRIYEHADILVDVEEEIVRCEEKTLFFEIIRAEIKEKIDYQKSKGYLSDRDAEAIMALGSFDEMFDVLELNQSNGERLAYNFDEK